MVSKLQGLLEDLSLIELQDLTKLVQNTISLRIKNKKTEFLAKAKILAKEYGINPDDIIIGKNKYTKETKKVNPKFGHPDDSAKVWTGRGHKPLWVKELLNNGYTLEALRISHEYTH